VSKLVNPNPNLNPNLILICMLAAVCNSVTENEYDDRKLIRVN